MKRTARVHAAITIAVVIPVAALTWYGWWNLEREESLQQSRRVWQLESMALGAAEQVRHSLGRLEARVQELSLARFHPRSSEPPPDLLEECFLGYLTLAPDAGLRPPPGTDTRLAQELVALRDRLHVEGFTPLQRVVHRGPPLGPVVELVHGAFHHVVIDTGEQTQLAAVRPVLVGGRELWLVGLLVDLRQVVADASVLQHHSGARVELASPAWTPPPDEELRQVLSVQVDSRRAPGYQLVVLEELPSEISISYRATRRRYLIYVAIMILVVGGGLAAMWKLLLDELQLTRDREDFLSAVTHELRTPLTAIRMFAEMLEDGETGKTEVGQRYLSRILAESDRLERLIDNVLDFATAGRRRKVLTIQPGDLGGAVRQYLAGRRTTLQRDGFSVTLEVAEGLPEVPFDRLSVERILGNLVDNAVKYSVGSERREIEISVGPTEEGVRLAVGDRGCGLDRKDQRRIFDRFFRSGDELTRRTPGVGLGLAIVRSLVQEHGGRVLATNRRGGGALFTVTFPRAPHPPPEQSPAPTE